MQDTFDSPEYKDILDGLYPSRVWSELEDVHECMQMHCFYLEPTARPSGSKAGNC